MDTHSSHQLLWFPLDVLFSDVICQLAFPREKLLPAQQLENKQTNSQQLSHYCFPLDLCACPCPCVCVCVWFCLAVCYFLTATCISWQLCVQCGFQSVSFCLGVLFVLCDDVCVCVLKSRLQDADIIGAEDLTHCSLPLNWAPALYGRVGSETSSPQSWRVEEIIVAKWYTGI